jgi:hypothetical protein
MNEYLSILVTLLIGLSITDMLVSLHRLLRAGKAVRWHWMTPTLSFIMLLQLLGFWWLWFDMYKGWASISVAQFLPDLAIFLCLFLACAIVLPSDVPAEGLDLKAYYYDTSRQFWSLFALYVAVATVFLSMRFSNEAPISTLLLANATNIILMVCGFALSRTRKAWAHIAFLALLLPFTVLVQSQMTIRADTVAGN